MKWLLFAFVVPALTSAFAGEAIFAPDGKAVYVCAGRGANVWNVAVADGKVTEIDFAKDLGADDEIKAITGGPKGTCWIASRLTLWSWSPAEAKLTRRLALKGEEIDDVAYNPATNTLFITGRFGEAAPFAEGLRALHGTEKEVTEPRLSLDPLVAPVFDREGRFYFRHESDLWVGAEVPGSDDVMFQAFRAVPLGNVFSEAGMKRGSKVIASIAPAGKGLYVVMGSAVEAELIFLPRPTGGKDPGLGPAGLKEAWKRMAANLQAATTIPVKGTIASISALCASPDGTQVFFQTLDDDNGERKFRLLETKARKIRVLGDVPAAAK